MTLITQGTPVEAFDPTKPCYMFDPQTGAFTGQGVAYKNPIDPGYLAPPNATYVAPIGKLKQGQGFRVNAKADGWQIVPDWTNAALFYKATALPAKGVVAFGETLPDTVTAATLPSYMPGVTYPEWDGIDNWLVSDDLSGKAWYHDDGREGYIGKPWEKPPAGAKIGVRPANNLTPAAQRTALLNEASAMEATCNDMLAGLGGHVPTTGDDGMLYAVKLWRAEILKVDITKPPVVFPPAPPLTFGFGDIKVPGDDDHGGIVP